jgi:hypothetical protein
LRFDADARTGNVLNDDESGDVPEDAPGPELLVRPARILSKI